MKQAVSIPKGAESCKTGQKAEFFYKIKNREQGGEKQNTISSVSFI